MKEIILWAVVSGFLFTGFLTLLIFGLIKKNKRMVTFSVLTFIFFAFSAVWTGYKLARKSYYKISNAVKPRTGQQIYSAMFGEQRADCVKVINNQDQVVPKIDYAIWLEFETCPNELKRVLLRHSYTSNKKATKNWVAKGPLANDNWFKPETLGDTVLVFEYRKDNYGNLQTIYSSLDSTKVYCIDILD